MRKIYKVKIGEIYLTKDGTQNALGCYLDIINIRKLRELYTRTAIPTVGGTVIQTFQSNDVPFSVQVASLPRAVGESLIDLFNDVAASGELLEFAATDGGGPDLSFDCELVVFDYKDSQSDIWKDAEIQLVKKS